MSEQKKAVIFCLLALVLGAMCIGCNSAGSKPSPVKYSLHTSCPDVWADEPTQTVSVKMEFSR